MQISPIPVKQNLYIRKLNGFGEKISVEDCVKIRELKEIVRQLKSLQAQRLKQKEFNLIFKGKNITENSQSTLKQLGIPYDGIIHLVFASDQQKKSDPLSWSQPLPQTNHLSHPIVTIQSPKSPQITLKVMFNSTQHQFTTPLTITVLQLKKKIASRLNLIYQSLVLSHLGQQMLNDKSLASYSLQPNTLISLRFNLHKPQKKKLQTRMVSSVTFSDENNEPNKNLVSKQLEHGKSKLATSSKSISSDKEETQQEGNKLTSLLNSNTRPMMYKSDINSFGSNQTSKAAMMFKNALHQKIVETQSVVSGSFSQENSISGNDPNSLMVTVKNQQDTKQFTFECQKTHQILNIREKLMQIQKLPHSQKIQISMEEDLFQSIDLNKSGCVTLSEIVKKMGKERAVFIYRLI